MTTRVQGLNTDGEILRDVYVEHEPVDIDCQAVGDGMTRQEFPAECDINTLMDRYEKTGVLTHFSKREPLYVDLTEHPIGDLQGMLDRLDSAHEAFMTLPAKVRREFDQDPVKFVEFCAQKENLSQLREWGLAPPAKPVDAPAAIVPTPVLPSVEDGG